MAGHGRLCPRNLLTKSPIAVIRWKYATTGLRWVILPWLILMLAGNQIVSGDPASNLQTSQNQTLNLALDFEWTVPQPQYCHLRLRLLDESTNRQCMIQKLENLSESNATTAAFTLSQDGTQITFQPRSQVDSVRVRLRVLGTPKTRIVLEALDDPRNPASTRSAQPVRKMSLAELLEKKTLKSEMPFITSNTARQQPNWSISRAEKDELRLAGLKAVPVYEPGATLELAAAVNAMTSQASSVLTFHYAIIQVSNQKTVARHRKSISINAGGNSDVIPISAEVPETPGVYEIRCHLVEDDDRIWDRLRRRESPLLKTGRPFFVVPKSGTRLPSPVDTWKIAGTLKPAESNWSVGQWLPKTTTRFLPGVNSSKPEIKLEQTQHVNETVSLLPMEAPFQASLPVMSTGTPHKIQLRLPATQNVRLQVEVSGLYDRDDPSTKFILSDAKTMDLNEQWRTYTFVHYPANEDQIRLTNLGEDVLQIESIEVQAGPQYLTSPISTENDPATSTQHRNTVLQLDDIDWIDSLSQDVSPSYELQDFDIESIEAFKLWIALNRACDLARASGMNGIMLPANAGGRTLFQTRNLLPRTDLQNSETNRLATTISLMAGQGLKAHVHLDPDFLLLPVEQAILQRPALIQKLTRIHENKPFQYNLLHPLVQDSLQELLAELIFQCKQSEHFAGITLNCGSDSHLQPVRQIFDDKATLAAFAGSLNVTVDTAQLQSWSQGEGRPTYEDWVLKATNRCYRDLQSIEPQIALHLKLEPFKKQSAKSSSVDTGTQVFKPDQSSPIDLGRSYDYGDSPLLIRPALRVPLRSKESGSAATVFFNTKLQIPNASLVQTGDMILEDTCHLIERRDPASLVINLPMDGRMLRPKLNTLLQTFQTLPRTGLRSVKVQSRAQNAVCVKSVQSDGFLYLACLCLTPWANDIEIETSQPVDWKAIGENPDETRIEQLSSTTARVQVSKGRLILLQSNQPVAGVEILSCKTRLSGGSVALAEIKRKVTLVAQRIGILFDFESYDALNNGGFENAGGLGLVGWLHAQHPAGCVRVDDTQPLEGKHSILLTTESDTTARTWLVSETITPPESGRLAVSLACRAETGENVGTHRLRVSLEATENEKPIRYSNEFEIPRNGQWGSREVRLEALNIDAENVHSLRLTIDSLSSGRIWIDDIRLHDQFPTVGERDELQSEAFLAVQGLQKSNLAPAGRLLQNGWAQHLLKLAPLQITETTKKIEAEVEKKEETPGIAERIRDWIPRPLRF